jgi:bifunctional glutamyl/prolyl-tRNA synthetase
MGPLSQAQREAREESKNRSNSPAKNLQLWQEMVKGTDVGLKCAVRAKIDMKSDNGCMRDPTIYRCKPESHPATKDRFKVRWCDGQIYHPSLRAGLPAFLYNIPNNHKIF